ncbi:MULTISPECIES: pirin family protein [Alteromonadaceae]|uniref:Pirin family protein n=1 Tax=Brumicola blandensis TaxID=3075611 RepID=A0AAW8R1Q8_9ALTE|nr:MULTISPECIES: pirin family protein [unclassified Alteromonas]MDT0582830.1 pirin family protein [Alteromonas sp. W409]MDT0628246.1 pirin family protein [Alteromonas sp. W364]
MAKELIAKEHDLGGLTVKRVLPHFEKKMVGPFIFFDHMGPTQFKAGQGINVRPHPHIGLSTLTYLFEGGILHRDSLGNHLEILPGDVNWMTAGKGIVHSERETFEVRANPHAIDGLQCWIALPEEMAELEPSFIHVKKQQLPQIIFEDVMMRLVVGEAFGLSSPVKTYSPMFYLDIAACAGSNIERPNPTQEAAVYVISGKISVAGTEYGAGQFVLFEEQDMGFSFLAPGRVVMLGGQKFEKTPYLKWNFVSFNKDRIDQAVDDWRERRFPDIPDDNKEFIPF